MDFKAPSPCVREGNGVESRVLEIDHPAALETNQVVVPVRFSLETRRRSRVAYLARYPDLDESLQNAIHGGS